MTRWSPLAAAGVLTALCTLSSAARADIPAPATPAAPEVPPTPLQVRSWAASCVTCHSATDTSAHGIPALAAGSAEELLQKLQQFKTGQKTATVMQQLTRGYTDLQLQALAAHFATPAR